ncbi:MAG: hypothetical protein COA40_03530 [Aequorivita sp.]|nr:MAG: hypothetical protein COA40_03530 [Aequorivita sp.]
MGRHHSFYGINNVPPYNNPFDYIIEADGNEQMLTVTNVNGDQAIYGTQPILSTHRFNENSIVFYPNPVKNELILRTSQPNAESLKIKIYNMEGKLLKSEGFNFQKEVILDISNFSKGLYFLNIEDENGNSTTNKFIIE